MARRADCGKRFDRMSNDAVKTLPMLGGHVENGADQLERATNAAANRIAAAIECSHSGHVSRCAALRPCPPGLSLCPTIRTLRPCPNRLTVPNGIDRPAYMLR